MDKQAQRERALKVMQAVLQGTNGMLLYQFALNNPGVDMHRIQCRLLTVGGCLEIQRFAADIKGANKSLCRNRVMEIADPWEAYWFATEIPGSSCMQDRIFLAGCSKVAYYFARDVEGADIVKLFAYAKRKEMRGLDTDEMKDFLRMAKEAHEGGVVSSNSRVVQNLYAKAIDPMVDRQTVNSLFKQAEALSFAGLTQMQYESFRSVAEESVRERFMEVL